MTREHNLDPRTKLVIVLCLSTLGIAVNNLALLSAIALLSYVAASLFRANLKRTFRKIKSLIYMLLFIALVQSIFTRGEPLLSAGGFAILTVNGVERALQFILRMAIVIFSATIIGTSSSRSIIQGLVQWKLPYDIAFMAALGIRFLPMLREEIRDLLVAIQLRGIDIKNIPIKERISLYSYLFNPLLVGTLLKAERLSIAMEMRGFRAYDKRTSYLVLKFTKLDYLIMFFSIAITAVFLIISYM